VSRVARGAGDQSPGCATSWTEYSRADWAEREVGPEPRSRARGWELREKRAASGVGGGEGDPGLCVGCIGEGSRSRPIAPK
jgi:hypothetical protein